MSDQPHDLPARDDELLLGYLLDALEDDERLTVEQRLLNEPALHQRLVELNACMDPLRQDEAEFEPPPELATRTCGSVFARMAAASAPWLCDMAGRWSLRDTVMAVTVVAAMLLLFFPAIGNSRFNAQMIGCQENLRHLGRSLALYGESEFGRLPQVPLEGDLATPAIYASLLKDRGLLVDEGWVNCPAVAVSREPLRVPGLEEFANAGPEELRLLRRRLGDYGYILGVRVGDHYLPVRHRSRTHFALMADAPTSDLQGQPGHNHGRRGFNVLFECGRVKFLRCCSPDGRDNFFLNDLGAVAPGLHEEDAVIAPSDVPRGVFQLQVRLPDAD